ncbi:MAG: alkaline phosphatase [Candidatus Amulumruptor caecigallinarius]|nr:alkaline phosphatase [Candidatus Amulumruptor caecigallinarius]MCM1396488.1 alkaline phosphatase [Candidatus Amulumruptor caecigallinarius]MCM1453455.1 alkaline phosphatase [bacterium]
MKILRNLLSITLAATALSAAADDAKYIFYFIGDGMGTGHATATESYLRDVRHEAMPLMMTFPVGGQSSTYSASSPVTDSAAAGTALATGRKTRNGMLGMDPDTTEVTSIAKRLKYAGYGVGLLTTVAPDDATPAAFYAHVPNRKMYYEIGAQAADSGVDFFAGSNWRGAAKKDGTPTDLTELFAKGGYTTVRGTAGLDSIKAEKLVVLNTDSLRLADVGYTLDSIGGVSLPEMTAAALSHLQRVSPERFFMMVEGGNIDWAGHANDGATIIKEVMNFNEALQQAYDFYKAHPEETLIVVTADHETGGMAMGNNYLDYDANLALIDRQRVSKDEFNNSIEAMLRSKRIYSWSDIRDELSELFGFWAEIPLTEAQNAALEDAYRITFEDRTPERTKTYYKYYSPLVMTVFRILQDHYGLGFTTGNHSGNMVPVYAIGAGAEKFAGFYDNVDIPMKIMEAAGVK